MYLKVNAPLCDISSFYYFVREVMNRNQELQKRVEELEQLHSSDEQYLVLIEKRHDK